MTQEQLHDPAAEEFLRQISDLAIEDLKVVKEKQAPKEQQSALKFVRLLFRLVDKKEKKIAQWKDLSSDQDLKKLDYYDLYEKVLLMKSAADTNSKVKTETKCKDTSKLGRLHDAIVDYLNRSQITESEPESSPVKKETQKKRESSPIKQSKIESSSPDKKGKIEEKKSVEPKKDS